jgi:hypothetical protein
MLAEDGKQAGRFIHALKADRTCRQFEQIRWWWCKRLAQKRFRGTARPPSRRERIIRIVREAAHVCFVWSQELNALDEHDMTVLRLGGAE